MAKKDTLVFSHWFRLFEGQQESPKKIYELIEASVEKCELPETFTARIHYYEGGPLSAKREYLRISRRDLFFDICAAHFGKGMFVSWWLSEDRSSKGIWILIGVLFFSFISLGFFVDTLGFFSGLFFELLVLMILFVVVGLLVRDGAIRIEDSLLETPFIGVIYERLFHPVTYFKKDTALMFQESIRLAVNEVLDGITATKGLKALTEIDKKPIMNDLLRR